MVQKWYQLKAKEEFAELYIYGDICSIEFLESDTSSFSLAKELANLGDKPLNVHINSYGGEVKEGLGIYRLLKDYPGKVTTVCDGFACSAASVVFMAGEKRVMHPTSLLMIHNAWTSVDGNADELRKMADDLEKITEPSIEAYVEASHLERDEIKAMMDAETWITAQEALEYGFATEIVEQSIKQSAKYSVIFGLVQKLRDFESEKLEKEQLEIKQEQTIDESPSVKGWFFHK